MRDAGLGQLPGRQPRALQVRPRLVDQHVHLAAGVVRGLDDAERGAVLAAGERPGVAMGEDPDRPAVGHRQDRQPEARQPAVVGRGLEHDRIGLGAQRVRDRVAVIVELADLDVPGHDPVDRPAQVDRGRPGVDQRVGRAADDRLAGVRQPVALLLGGHRQPDRGDLADRRGTTDDHLADRVGHLPGRPARVLDERVGQPALVDQVDDARRLRGTASGTRSGRSGSGSSRRRPVRAGPPRLPG